MLDAAQAQYEAQKALSARTARAAAALWLLLDPADLRGSWRALLARLTLTVTAAQLLAAQVSGRYVANVLEEQSIAAAAVALVNPRAFAGIASDGRPLDSLLDSPVISTRTALGHGVPLDEALARGLADLIRIVETQVADAGRAAESVGMVVRPAVDGWVRMLELPSCDRCVVLAGKFFRYNQGFQRHPGCDCRHIPTSEDRADDLRTDPRAAIEAGQVRGLSAADTKAILDGADVGQVINAKRGMYTADVVGRRVKATRARAGRGVRLRPEAIYREAGDDRDEALRLLRRFGYLT